MSYKTSRVQNSVETHHGNGTAKNSFKEGFPFLGPFLQIISVPLSSHNSQIQAGVAISRVIPLVPHQGENWPVIVSFLFSGVARQLDCRRLSYDSREEMVARLLGDLPRLFLLVGECSGVAPHRNDGSSANWTVFQK